MSADPGQLAFNELWVCTTCGGAGGLQQNGQPPTPGALPTMRCPTCQGAGTLEYDPADTSQIPF